MNPQGGGAPHTPGYGYQPQYPPHTAQGGPTIPPRGHPQPYGMAPQPGLPQYYHAAPAHPQMQMYPSQQYTMPPHGYPHQYHPQPHPHPHPQHMSYGAPPVPSTPATMPMSHPSPYYSHAQTAMNSLLWQPSPEQQNQLNHWFRHLGGEQGWVGGASTVEFLMLSNLDRAMLRTIWSTIDTANTGKLSQEGFFNVMRLISFAISTSSTGVSLQDLQRTSRDFIPLPSMEKQLAEEEFGEFADATVTEEEYPSVPTQESTNPFDALLEQAIPPPATPPTLLADDPFDELQVPHHEPVAIQSRTSTQIHVDVAVVDDDDGFGDFEVASPVLNGSVTPVAAAAIISPKAAKTEGATSVLAGLTFEFETTTQLTQLSTQTTSALSTPQAPFVQVDEQWKKRMSALDDLAELDLAAGQEDWEDFADASTTATTAVDVKVQHVISETTEQSISRPLEELAQPSREIVIDARSTTVIGHVETDEWAEFEEANDHTPKQPAVVPPPVEIDLLDFGAPVEETILPPQAAFVSSPMTALVDDSLDDEWTDFTEGADGSSALVTQDAHITPTALENLAEELCQLNQYEQAYQCICLAEVLEVNVNKSSTHDLAECTAQVGRWKDTVANKEAGEELVEVVELLGQMDPQCATRYKKDFLEVTQSRNKVLKQRIMDGLKCKRAARVMLTVRTTHNGAKDAWASLLTHVTALLQQAVDRCEVLHDFDDNDMTAIRADPKFRVFISGAVECFNCCMCLLASYKEAGWAADNYSRVLDLCNNAVAHLALFLFDSSQQNHLTKSIDDLIAEAAEAAASLPRRTFCNLTLRPLDSVSGPIHASKIVAGACYIYSIAQVWQEQIRQPLPRTDCIFD